VAGDIGDEQHCQDIVQTALKEFGHIDILVNNAAFQQPVKKLGEISSELWDRHFKTNIYGMFYLCKAAEPHMQPGSTIINTASIQAFNPSGFLLAYASTKGAIVTFSEALAQMLGEQGIRVNAVAPGPVWTPLIASGMPEEAVPDFGKSTPLGRPAQPAELAPVYVLLASPEASYVSGKVYGVTGGKPLF
jgi:NAD(P)-dependent dehydrogenase (short-subunit alcohol dehydrogenase family)